MRGKIKMQNYFRICVMLLLCLVPNILGKAVLVPGKTDSGDVEKKQINAQSHILQNQNLNDVEENDMNQGNANKKNSDTLRVEHMQVEEPLKKLDKEDLNPPDHLDAVRMEQDGHLNKDWRKEVFLGEHEDFDQSTREEQDQKLKMVFYRVDTDKDAHISYAEMETWIQSKVKEHFDEAAEENNRIFKALDTNKDGFVSWTEYCIQFLVAHGYDQKTSEKYMEDYEIIEVNDEVRDHMVKNKFRWSEADEDPMDNQLNLREFKAYRHPEQSFRMLDNMVRDILESLDANHDSILTEQEFIALPPGEVESEWRESDKLWQDERRKEFQNTIDIDKNGKVTKDELKQYVDPLNINHSKTEAKNLVDIADTDHDEKISIDEVMENRDIFLGSKMMDTGKSFHDEF